MRYATKILTLMDNVKKATMKASMLRKAEAANQASERPSSKFKIARSIVLKSPFNNNFDSLALPLVTGFLKGPRMLPSLFRLLLCPSPG
ncbi:hypothetical protein HU200_030256 [Digitaria exilis]|uniref:Uncharacterized protein n=1 Tax=Digitaria exilis TaxID=1010633 RepID=A0A835BTH3_9POAL|nr:hypothetical protein HU200_030256 [Digitaria exilis]